MFNFDFSNGYVILRVICGLFIIPHAIGKITARDAVFGFFTAAGLRPVAAWVYTTMAVEWLLAICLVFGLFTQLAALVGALFMLVAAIATWKVSKGRWLWNLGGAEYPLFWGACCLIVALNPS